MEGGTCPPTDACKLGGALTFALSCRTALSTAVLCAGLSLSCDGSLMALDSASPAAPGKPACAAAPWMLDAKASANAPYRRQFIMGCSSCCGYGFNVAPCPAFL